MSAPHQRSAHLWWLVGPGWKGWDPGVGQEGPGDSGKGIYFPRSPGWGLSIIVGDCISPPQPRPPPRSSCFLTCLGGLSLVSYMDPVYIAGPDAILSGTTFLWRPPDIYAGQWGSGALVCDVKGPWLGTWGYLGDLVSRMCVCVRATCLNRFSSMQKCVCWEMIVHIRP